MKSFFAVIFLFFAVACSATPPAHAPYKIISDGLDLHPKSISPKFIGSLCSVFFLPGRPEVIASVGGPDPEGMIQYVGKVRVVTGKIIALQGDELTLAGYYTRNGERDGTRIHKIRLNDVDRVIIKNKS